MKYIRIMALLLTAVFLTVLSACGSVQLEALVSSAAAARSESAVSGTAAGSAHPANSDVGRDAGRTAIIICFMGSSFCF